MQQLEEERMTQMQKYLADFVRMQSEYTEPVSALECFPYGVTVLSRSFSLNRFSVF